MPSASRMTASAWSSSSGLEVITTVVRPARALARRTAIRASVWVSTALVGPTRTNAETLATGEGPAPFLDVAVESARQGFHDVLTTGDHERRKDRLVVVDAVRVELFAQ